METFGSVTKNPDNTTDHVMGMTNGVATGSLFVTGYTDGNKYEMPKKPSFDAAGTSLSVQVPAGGASVQATHIPNYGKQLKAAANVNLIDYKNHKVDAHAFTTRNLPESSMPYSTHGGGVNYSFKDKVGVGASTAYTPIEKKRENTVTSNLNLHPTPNSSLSVGLGASQVTSPFGRGNVEPKATLSYTLRF